MREATVLVVSAIAVLLGLCIGCVMRPKVDSSTSFAPVRPSDSAPPKRIPVTKVVPTVAPPEPMDANSTPEAVHAWRRKDKEEIVQRVERLSASEAENLCFSLNLIPRDEVFDKINVKGRLKRYIDGLRTPAELDDVETAFREAQGHH